MIDDQADLSHLQTLARSTSTRDGEPSGDGLDWMVRMGGRLACLFFFLAID